MKKTLLIAFIICFHSNAGLQAQTLSSLSGIYQKLTLGVDPVTGTVTGYYREIDDPPNRPSSECTFYLSGNRQGDKYAIQAWQPEKHQSEAAAGELRIFPAEKDRPSVLLKLEKLSRDCTALQPKLGEAEGALFDQSKVGAWTEVRLVGDSKSHYYQIPDSNSPQRDSARRGTVLTVVRRQPGWAEVQSDQKSKGWIQENDLYPPSPVDLMEKPAEPASPLSIAAPKGKSQTEPEPKLERETSPKPDMASNSKAELLQRLKTLNAQAFDLALRALSHPAERDALTSPRMALEKELDSLVDGLKKAEPSAYRNESSRIYEAYLDLQYVRKEQPVVSQRLWQAIQKQSP